MKVLIGLSLAIALATSSCGSPPERAFLNVQGEKVELEVARTLRLQQKGLMHREALADDEGMLFLFKTPQVVQFWMKNVLIPLDMIFLLDGKVVAIFANRSPCRSNPCPGYGPSTPIDTVIELPGGRAQELGIQVGDTLVVN